MSPMHEFEHFVRAQDRIYTQVLAELRDGEKRSHWMWFILPQLAGLGSSAMAREFALTGRDDARRFLEHPVLGARLLECAALVLGVNKKSAVEIFGRTDAMKLRSSATLFAEVSPPGSIFSRLLDRFFEGVPDPATMALLERDSAPDVGSTTSTSPKREWPP